MPKDNSTKIQLENGFFNRILQGILNHIQQEIPEVQSTEIWDANLDNINDYKRNSEGTPSVLIALNAITSATCNPYEQLEVTLQFSLLVIVEDVEIAGDKQAYILYILEKILLLVKNGSWEALENLAFTENGSISARNIGAQYVTSGIAAWGITWQQKCLIGEDIWGDNPKTKLPRDYEVKTAIDGVHAEDVDFDFPESEEAN